MGRIVINATINVLVETDPIDIREAYIVAQDLGLKLQQATRVNFINKTTGRFIYYDLKFSIPPIPPDPLEEQIIEDAGDV